MKITRTSVITNITRTRDIPLNPEDMVMWTSYDMSIEEAMPYLSDDDKQFILSGIIPCEWDGAFAEDLQTV